MPKTKNAFAFRQLLRGIELDRKGIEFARIGDRENALKCKHEAEFLMTEPFQSKKKNYQVQGDRLASIIQTERNCRRDIMRSTWLLVRLRNHEARLDKIESRCPPSSSMHKRVMDLKAKYAVVKQHASAYINLMLELKKYNEEILRNAFNEELGDRLRRARRQKGYTQNDMARLLGVSKSCYTHYELGRREIPPVYVYRLSDALNVSTEYLFSR